MWLFSFRSVAIVPALTPQSQRFVVGIRVCCEVLTLQSQRYENDVGGDHSGELKGRRRSGSTCEQCSFVRCSQSLSEPRGGRYVGIIDVVRIGKKYDNRLERRGEGNLT